MDPNTTAETLLIRGFGTAAINRPPDRLSGSHPCRWKAVKRSEEFRYSWMGATWLFASAANRDQFAANPAQYAPQFGGYCSYAVSMGHTASIDPEA